ncbi:MAG: hypothetical protein K2X77_25910 [Candidatus Obscuribacterales bacterium]|nr:hypothetical protein [Candidatus Obscuribacterales bacterium]
MGSRSTARTPRNTTKPNQRIDVEGLESFFLDDHKELLAKGLNLKEAVYYYGDSKTEIREKIRNGEIPAIRIPDPEGPKWCIFPDGVPSALKHLIPSNEEPEQKAESAPSLPETQKSSKKHLANKKASDSEQENAVVSENVAKPKISRTKKVDQTTPEELGKENNPETAIPGAAVPEAAISKPTTPSQPKSQRNAEPAELIVPPLQISFGVIEGNIADFGPAPTPSSLVQGTSSDTDAETISTGTSQDFSAPPASAIPVLNLQQTGLSFPASFLITNSVERGSLASLSAAFQTVMSIGIQHTAEPSKLAAEKGATDATSNELPAESNDAIPLQILQDQLAEFHLPNLVEQHAMVIESDQDFEQFPSSDWPPASFVINTVLPSDPYQPAYVSPATMAYMPSVEAVSSSKVVTEVVHSLIISDASPNSSSLPLGSILEALIPTLDFEADSERNEEFEADRRPELLRADQLQSDLHAQSKSTNDMQLEQTFPNLHSLSEFAAIRLEQPALEDMLTRIERAALNAVDEFLPELELGDAKEESPAVQVWVSEDIALPIAPILRRVDRQEASRNRSERSLNDESIQAAAKFERVADLYQKVNELDKALREAHYKNNYLEARLTGMEDQLKYLSQNHYSAKSWNTYTIIILGLLTVLAVIAIRLFS